MNILKSIGGTLLGIAIFIGVIVATILFFTFGAKMAFEISPFINGLAGVLIIINVVLLLFAAIPSARGVIGNIIIFSSFIYGLSAWIYGLAVTLAIWGWLGVIIGVFLGGIGVVPIGMLASVLSGHWDLFWPLLINVATYFVAIIIGGLLVGSAERRNEKIHDNIIDVELEGNTTRTWGDLE